jgi:hypothetical protein
MMIRLYLQHPPRRTAGWIWCGENYVWKRVDLSVQDMVRRFLCLA